MFTFSSCRGCRTLSETSHTDIVAVSFRYAAFADKLNREDTGTTCNDENDGYVTPETADGENTPPRRLSEGEEKNKLMQEWCQRLAAEDEWLLRRQLERAQEVQEEVRKEKEAADLRQQEALKRWLARVEVGDVNVQKRIGILGYTYPLHLAVKECDTVAVRLLLGAGADKAARDSSRVSALELARKLDKNGSHQEIMDLLAEVI